LRKPTPTLDLVAGGLYPNQVFISRVKPHWPTLAILLLAAVLRLWALDIKPPHFDEGVNGWFADQMTRTGYYRYDPTNYHGPLHFYAVFLSQTLGGRNLWALRLPAILSSLLAIWAILRLGKYIGQAASRFAALALAVSPAFVFYGRYSIHESWLLFFCILLLWAVFGLWREGHRRYLAMAVGAITGMILTKETYILHVGSFALAGLVLAGWQLVFPSRPPAPLARQEWKWKDMLCLLGLAAIVIVFFYSGTFRDFRALKGLVDTYAAWFSTGVEAAGHEKKDYDFGPLNFYWVALMARYEWPALLGFVACFRYVFSSDARIRYTAIMGGGVLLAYSLVPYKTPWCIISVIWPFPLILGAWLWPQGVQTHRRLRLIASIILLTASLIASIRLNFFHFTDENEPYVYVQTHQDVSVLTEPLAQKAKADPTFLHSRGVILLDSYYPLPWIFGDYTAIGYYDTAKEPEKLSGTFIVCEKEKAERVESKLVGQYYRREFRLRDGMSDCYVYFNANDFRDIFPGNPDIIGQ